LTIDLRDASEISIICYPVHRLNGILAEVGGYWLNGKPEQQKGLDILAEVTYIRRGDL
jgi:hypothetical protein